MSRGRLWQALYFLQRIRTRTLSLVSERHGLDSDDFVHVDELPVDETRPMESALVASLSPDDLVPAIERASRVFLDELRRHDPALADRLDAPFSTLLEATQAAQNG